MQITEQRTVPADGIARSAGMQTSDHELDIVLEPLSRPDLGEIRIRDSVFAVGRTERPFASYGEDVLGMLSRRHARIFCESGVVYLADLGSRNGTTVNRGAIGEAPSALSDGDEVCFGGVLSYRVRIAARARERAHTASEGTDLEPIVITRFPFLVSKSDALFARCRDAHGRQLSFLSRRHAHIFRKDGGAYIEDLESTNGTFVDGLRLQEHAAPLEDGALLAFGGDHFTYRVSIGSDPRTEPAEPVTAVPPTANRPTPRQAAKELPVESGKTTFVAAPTSFLDIFCVETRAEESSEPTASPAPEVAAVQEPARRRARGRSVVLWSEIAEALAGSKGAGTKRSGWKGAAVVGAIAVAAVALYLHGAPERELKDAVARGEFARAATLANRKLEQHPDDVDLKALATETALKAHVPAWLAKLQARDFDGARTVLAGLSELGARNPDLLALVDELEWLGNLERLVDGRGGADAPIRIYVDEDRIAALIDRWNVNTGEHQRALARIASHVPQFGAPYAEALTHLRKLQSDATVYLAAIERLKTTIAAELNRDRPEALESVLADAAEKYPGLGGLDGVRQDLARYIEIRKEARSRQSGRLFALLLKARFTTPPFQDGLRTLAANRQLPAGPLVQQYAAATQAWKEGDTTQGLAGLQAMAAGPWAGAVASEIERRQAVITQFAAVQAARSSAGYADQLLAFRTSLDAEEDVHFARATQADLEQQKDKALGRAQESMGRARALWQEYRGNGAIDAMQRVETAISNSFRTRARLLATARRQAQLALQIYAQLNAVPSAEWRAIHEEIRIESEQQRSALAELRNVLEPELLRAKLALLGDASE
jgi:pSer/pThr/pTyr-binding forkhead associated (FHA) protein